MLFLDVLGTSELANQENAQDTLTQLDSALRRARTRSQLDESWNWADSSWFSDNLVIAAPLGVIPIEEEGILGTVLGAAMWLQYLLAIEGFFTRGGLTVGSHFMDRKVNFGPALVTAVGLERSAIQPRVILDDHALKLVHRHAADYAKGAGNPFEAELMVADDGITFLSYLAAAFEADDADEAAYMVELHRDAVIAKLARHREDDDDHVYAKYVWTANYHNAFSRRFDRRRKELLVPDVDGGRFRGFRGRPRQ